MPVDADVLRVRIAWATAPLASSPSWTDITVSNFLPENEAKRQERGVRELSWVEGRKGPAALWDVGSLSMVCNNRDGDWDQANPAGSDFGVANLKRNKRIQVQASDDSFSTNRIVFDGFIDDIRPQGTNLDSIATVTASDPQRILAEYDLDDVARSEEWAGDRIAALLTQAGIPAGFVGTIQNGTVRMPAETYNTDALSAIQQCAKADCGFFWWDHSAGQFEYRERWAQELVTAWNTRQHSFTQSGGGSTSEISHRPTQRALASFTQVTRVTASSSGGTDRTYEYDTTGTDEIPTTFTKTTHSVDVAYDSMVEYVPRYRHSGFDYSGERVDSVVARIYPNSSNALTAVADGYYVPLTRVEVQHTPLGFSSDFNYEAHIERVAHSVGPMEWRCEVFFSPWTTQLQSDMDSFYVYGQTLAGTDLGGY